MTCEPCMEAGRINRIVHDKGLKIEIDRHPDCGCPCQHREPTQWEDMYSIPRPE